METKKTKFLQFVKFACFSLSAGIIQLGADALLLEVAKFPAWAAYLIALVLSVIWNFTLNRKFTFKSSKNVPIAMLKVAGYYAVFTPLSTLWTYLIVDMNNLNDTIYAYVVLVVTMIINMLTEFLFQKYLVFNEKISKQENNDEVK